MKRIIRYWFYRLVRVSSQRAAAVFLQPSPLHARASPFPDHNAAPARRRAGARWDAWRWDGRESHPWSRRGACWMSNGGKTGVQSRAAGRAVDAHRHDLTWMAHLASYLEWLHAELDQDR